MSCSSWCCSAPFLSATESKGIGEAVITELKVVHAAASRLARGQVKKLDGAVVLGQRHRLLLDRNGFCRQGAVSRPLSRQEESTDPRRSPAGRHHRSHPVLSARSGQARARAIRHGLDPCAQSPVRRPHAVTCRYPDDAEDHRHCPATRDRCARSHRRGQGRPRELQEFATDLKVTGAPAWFDRRSPARAARPCCRFPRSATGSRA